MDYREDIQKARADYPANKKFLRNLKKRRPRDLDHVFQEEHEQVFEEVDCLQCANCCKTTSPIFRMADIERIAQKLKTSTDEFISDYLRLDEESDYVLKESPCAFLNEDNTCSIYPIRPKACREYPHTDRKRIHQIFNLTLENSIVCPAVSRILENVRSRY